MLYSKSTFALGENKPIHFSGDKQVWDRKVNLVELFGHAAVSQFGETLTADYIRLDLNSRVLDARGNCVYVATDSVIWGEEMHFNLDTRTGTVIGGRVSNDHFILRGDRINKLGEGRYQTHWGDYTTCWDCAPSWGLLAEDVDMQSEGYAYLTNVTTRVKDAPAFWMPYLVIPMKTRRQTGFLFPPFAVSGNNGFQIVLPFFWAISRSADMTLGVGEYTQRGLRGEWEGRYALSSISGGNAKAYYVKDRQFGLRSNRWGFNVSQTQEMPWGILEKFRVSEVSDNLYPFYFPADFSQYAGEAFLPSKLMFARPSPDVSAYVSFQRYRNLLNSTANDPVAQQLNFDSRTVQVAPSVVVTTNDKFIGNTSIVSGLTVGLTNFTRPAGPFDYDSQFVPFGQQPPPGMPFHPGIDPIREATRLSVTPSLYTTFRPFDVLSVVPSLQYHEYFYHFGTIAPNLNRGYLLFQTDLTAQFERIYEFPDDPYIPRAKHLIRPLLTYSYIPYLQQNVMHPFAQQITTAQNRATPIYGYNFDDNDIVPYSYSQTGANYFVPLGHSLSYGFTTQWIRRRSDVKALRANYQTAVEFSAGQAINFLELTKPIDPSDPHVFTRFFSILNLQSDHLLSQTTYYYYPDVPATTPRHTITTSATYVFERSTHQSVLTYDRSFTVGYTFSKVNSDTSAFNGLLNFALSDYLMPYGTVNYGFTPSPQLYAAGAGLQLQSPSRCWRLIGGINYNIGLGFSTSIDMSLNLTGSGFGGITELANQAQTGQY